MSCFGNAVIVFVAVIVAALVASAIGTNTRASIIGALVVFFGIWIGGWYLIHRMTNSGRGEVMAQPQMIQRVLGGDERVYTVSTIRLDQKPRGEMWETLVWQGGGCLSRKRSVRYVEYTISSPQTAGGMAAEAHKSTLEIVTMPPDQDDCI